MFDAFGAPIAKPVPGFAPTMQRQTPAFNPGTVWQPPAQRGRPWWHWVMFGVAGVAALALLVYGGNALINRTKKRRSNPRRKAPTTALIVNPKRTWLGDLAAMGSIAFGGLAVAFPDPAPFAGPSTLVGLPFMLGGLYYFGVNAKEQ